MFEFAAGQLQQEERERQIADGLRRRELLASASTEEVREPHAAFSTARADRNARRGPRTARSTPAHAER